ncbi:hypothetical protein Cni_G16552 [Canna indica]|uniref:BHLH domain-containing protein n=1 Tax=Canna indica TaxID=4628 RepID=A0AAQ3KFB5_9LILI|nr:hypothetical protein Cni_G16552 [Canna indica]
MEALWSSFDTTMSNEDCEIMALTHLFEQDLHDPSSRPPLMPCFSDTVAGSSSSSSYYYSSEIGNTCSNGACFSASHFGNGSNYYLSDAVPLIQEPFIGAIPVSPLGDVNPLNDETTSSNETGDPHMLKLKRKLEEDLSSESLKMVRVSLNSAKKVASSRAQKRSARCDEDTTTTTTTTTMISLNSCSYTSEDDSKSLQGLHGSNRADQEPSTNPQSLYARKRRERINERLRTLQNLIPNGTKVDISTMLEEAVHYVKFLQMQIKLLSSDELWMYAPIAYNGVNIGLDLKITPPN